MQFPSRDSRLSGSLRISRQNHGNIQEKETHVYKAYNPLGSRKICI